MTEPDNWLLDDDDDETGASASTTTAEFENPLLVDDEETVLGGAGWRPPTRVSIPSTSTVATALDSASTAVSVPASPPKAAKKRRKPNGSTYNRKLLNKHDDRLLLFLAKVKMANVRQLALAMGKTERQVQQKLKGLQGMKLTDNLIMANTKALWVVTPKGVSTLIKRGVLPSHTRVKGMQVDQLKRSSIGHKLAVATVAAQLVSGKNPLERRATARPLHPSQLIHESEITSAWKVMTHGGAAYPQARAADIRYEQWTTRVQRAVDFPDPEGIYRLFATRQNRNLNARQDYTKMPDLVATHADGIIGGAIAIEVELHEKSVEDYVEILKTYLECGWYNQVVYVTPKKIVAKRLLEAAELVDAEKHKELVTHPDFIYGMAHENWSEEKRQAFLDFRKAKNLLHVARFRDVTGTPFVGDPWTL